MRRALAVLLLLAPPLGAEEALTLTASDGVAVHATRWAPEGRVRATALLFHQASGNWGEYAEIGPRLAAQGIEAVAIDQRIGGAMFMETNRTMAGLDAPAMDFDSALLDMSAALDHARATEPDAPILLWGSSYAAGLAIVLGADDPEGVAGVLAFSPSFLSQAHSEMEAAARLAVPLFVTYGTATRERMEAKSLAGAAPLGELFTPEVGAHGSATLIPDWNPRGWEEAWAAVDAFLARVAP